MDVRSDPASPTSATPPLPPSPFEPNQLRSLLDHLGRGFARPLNALRDDLTSLLDEPPNSLADEPRGHLRTILALNDDLLDLTEGYLEYAALAWGPSPLRYGPVRLTDLISELDRRFAPEAAARRLAWTCSLAGDDSIVSADAARCQCAFGPLVTNALTYTPRGGAVLVSARREGAWWCLTVSDTGPGIPAEARARVFDPLYRLPRDERSGGPGLGLTISRALVTQLRGEITLDSGPDGGTLVSVRLPADRSYHSKTT